MKYLLGWIRQQAHLLPHILPFYFEHRAMTITYHADDKLVGKQLSCTCGEVFYRTDGYAEVAANFDLLHKCVEEDGEE